MIHLETNVRLAGGHWYADVCGLPLRCVQVYGVVPDADQPFILADP